MTMEVTQSDLQISERFGVLKSELQTAGQPVADADLLIAATALCNSATLVTGNTRHYQRIDGLAIENWMD